MQCPRMLRKACVDAGVFIYPANRGDPCAERERVSAEGASLVYRPGRCDQFHHLPISPECSDRESSPDNLSKGRDIGSDAVESLGSADTDPVSGYHLVEY